MHHTQEQEIDYLLDLINFEKAFDFLSWRYLYKIFKFFGFKKDIILRWVKLLNCDISARIIQCGVFSDSIKICRGAKQGDSIAAYLSILCIEILAIMIKNNKSIKGLVFDGIKHKLTQICR